MFAGISGCIGMLVAGLVTKFMEPRYVFQIAYIITGSTVLLLTIKHDFNFLTALSFVFGFAQGSGTTTSNIIFLTLVNKNRRAVAFGWANFMTSLAIVVAPPFAGNFSVSLLVFIEKNAPSALLSYITALEKCEKHSPSARAFPHFSRVLKNSRVLM